MVSLLVGRLPAFSCSRGARHWSLYRGRMGPNHSFSPSFPDIYITFEMCYDESSLDSS
jgi:hypothetical protein